MKNTKMKYKIFFLTMLLIISLNNVSGYEVYEGELESVGYSQTTKGVSYVSASTYDINAIGIKDGGLGKYITSVTLTADIAAWAGSTEYAHIKQDVSYEYNSVTVGTGYMYYWLQSTDADPAYEQVYVKCYFDNGLNLTTGHKIVNIVGFTGDAKFERSNSYNIETAPFNEKTGVIGKYSSSSTMSTIEGTHKAFHTVTFYNNYSYYYNEDLFTFYLNRNNTNPSELTIDNSYVELITESGLQVNPIYVYSDDIVNNTWNVDILDPLDITHNFQIDFIPEDEDITPTLTTDKSLYNTSEQITISFTNIDEIEEYFTRSDTLSIYILYSVTEDYADYRAKYAMMLHPDRRDESFTMNTSILLPQNEYHLAICDDGEYHRIEDALIISDIFYVYIDDEYINTNCNPDGNCYTGNNNDITIFYRVDNNSDIIVKDNNNDIIQTYYNIIGEGEINYHIPDDLNKLNSYPNWKIYLNNTEHSTSYNTDVTVYWSLFVEPTPTPIYTVDIPDENVTEQIDQLKEESKPLFDLIYGLTTLVIDNPDYDNDNIVDEHEINNWFNSLIPLGILLLIVVLYMGLKKR